MDSSHDRAGVPISFLAVLIAFGRSWDYWEGSLAKIFGGILISVQYGGFLVMGGYVLLQLDSLFESGRSLYRIPRPFRNRQSLVSSQGFDFFVANTWAAL